MSDMFGSAQINAVALTANVAKTVLQLVSPANHRVKLLGWGVFFDGVSATQQPIRVRLIRQTTAGTMTALTPKQMSTRPETIQSTAQNTATVEPSNADILEIISCHPQQGYEVKYTPGQELVLGGADRIGIEILSVNTMTVSAKLFFEE